MSAAPPTSRWNTSSASPSLRSWKIFSLAANPTRPKLEIAASQVAELMYLYNTGYVLLYPPIPQRYPYADHWQATWDFVKTTLPLEAEPVLDRGWHRSLSRGPARRE